MIVLPFPDLVPLPYLLTFPRPDLFSPVSGSLGSSLLPYPQVIPANGGIRFLIIEASLDVLLCSPPLFCRTLFWAARSGNVVVGPLVSPPHRGTAVKAISQMATFNLVENYLRSFPVSWPTSRHSRNLSGFNRYGIVLLFTVNSVLFDPNPRVIDCNPSSCVVPCIFGPPGLSFTVLFGNSLKPPPQTSSPFLSTLLFIFHFLSSRVFFVTSPYHIPSAPLERTPLLPSPTPK